MYVCVCVCVFVCVCVCVCVFVCVHTPRVGACTLRLLRQLILFCAVHGAISSDDIGTQRGNPALHDYGFALANRRVSSYCLVHHSSEYVIRH